MTLATTTLTCTKCNNTMGSQIESHLKARFENEAFLAGKSPKARYKPPNANDGMISSTTRA